ncbi:hypothetical protein JA33_289 [Dickeya phage vB_DsoM_JA33]|uniref:Uncharacterized protein n=2 Tax=Salmondvirus JA11 TaxID=2734141 RepID=A0A386K7Q4_9CAUD|nr:hypothetical protein HOU32_gp288 [Dickeya phage vB_DsoM_JA11]AXG67663.1 hypothetical protein JA33_289 [Dickeya phage vB_DsoM_JA33]AYD80093.1 hypothetical protein JA11_288 [Dickeya phage vB_DsoM_JA11]
MFPITNVVEIIDLAAIQNKLCDVAIQRGMLPHRKSKYSVFFIPVHRSSNENEVLDVYTQALDRFSLKLVTSIAKYKKHFLPLVVPIAYSEDPFFIHLDGDVVKIEMQPYYSELIGGAANSNLVSKSLVGAIVASHHRYDIPVDEFDGYLEGNFLHTIRTRLNRISWPRAAKESK